MYTKADVSDIPVNFDTEQPSFVAAIQKLNEDVAAGLVVTENPRWVDEFPGFPDTKTTGLGYLYARGDDLAEGIKNGMWAVDLGP